MGRPGTPRRRGERATGLPFGYDRVDDCLADGGLPLGRLHEIGGTGIETETGAVTAAFAAGILARLPGRGAILWCGLRDDLYGPGLAGRGVDPDRLIRVAARNDEAVLAVLERSAEHTPELQSLMRI